MTGAPPRAGRVGPGRPGILALWLATLLALPAAGALGASPGPSASVAPVPGSVGSPGPGTSVDVTRPSAMPTVDPSTGPVTDPRVDTALAALEDDRSLVGQLLLLSWDGRNAASARGALEAFRPAGLVFVTNASRAARATRLNGAIAAAAADLGMVPPIRAIDHEGGRVQRIDDVADLGSNRDFGRTLPSDLDACERGATHAEQLTAMGFDMDLAPVLDVATGRRDAVIGDRSYGGDADLVARLGAAYLQGLQGGGIIGAGKHFPGHGGTRVDSHVGLPVLSFSRTRLDQVELVPFVRAIAADVAAGAIMVGHLVVPALDPSGTPASLSRPIISGLLRGELGYDGVVMTDDLGAMDAITDRYDPGEAAVRAVEAGADLLIIVRDGDNQQAARDALEAALASGRLDRGAVIESVRRVLTLKARFGLLDGIRPPGVPCAVDGG